MQSKPPFNVREREQIDYNRGYITTVADQFLTYRKLQPRA